MNRKVLVVGGGVAGCACGYFLSRKGYEVTILEKRDVVGGLSRTYRYNGHPYEFGPHVWFWPHDDINDVIRELTDGDLYNVDRKLYTFTGENLYRYPIHYSDVLKMKDREKILKEWEEYRVDGRLDYSKLPRLGECGFDEYFKAAVGETLYARFMEQYTYKMWGIPGNKLDTGMVWADRIKDKYTDNFQYDPIKFKESYLGEGQPNWYPKKGWNVVWEGMVKNCRILFNTEVLGIMGYYKPKLLTSRGYFKCGDYGAVICTIHSDQLLGLYELPAAGKLVIPFLIPGLEQAYPDGGESIHYSDNIALTRATEMKRITRHESPDTLICLEIPVTYNSRNAFPENVMTAAHYHPRCYNWQTDEARAKHEIFVFKAKSRIGNLLFCGRHAQFKYWGMPEVVDSAYRLVKENF